jgi:hypothetical protein
MTKKITSKRKTTGSTPPRPRSKPSAKSSTAVQFSKSETIRGLLTRPGGASISELSEATGWQAHSVRGYLSGTLKKKLGLNLVTENDDSGRRYRLDGKSAGV